MIHGDTVAPSNHQPSPDSAVPPWCGSGPAWESPCFVGISLQNGGTWMKIAHKHKEMVILEILPHSSTSVSHHDWGEMFYKLRIKHPPTKLQVFSSSIFSWMIREMIQIDSYLRGLSWHDCHCLEEPGLNYTQGCDLRRLEAWKTCTRKFVIIQLRHFQESHQSSST